jgi:hypothetical protein
MHPALTLASVSMLAMMQPWAAAAAIPWIALHGVPGAEIETILFSPAAPANGLIGSDGGALFRTTNGGASWTRAPIGSVGEVISALAMAPTASNVMYAGSSGLGSPGVVYISQDGGLTWTATAAQPATPAGNLFVSGLIVDGQGTTALVSDATAGIFLTTNSGASWTNPLPNASVAALARSPAANGAIWAVGGASGEIPAVWMSATVGASWVGVPVTGLPRHGFANNVAIEPGSGRIFVSWYRAPSVVGKREGGLIVSSDGGTTWKAANSGLPSNVFGSFQQSWMVFDPAAAGHIVMGAFSAGGSNALFETTNDGASWSATGARVPGEVAANTVGLRPANGATPAALFAGLDDLFSGPLSTAALTPADTGMNNSTVLSATEDGSSAKGLFAATYHGVYHSANFGKTWTSVSGWPGSHYLFQLVPGRAPGAKSVYVLDGDDRAFASSDLGATWQEITPAGTAIAGIVADPGSAQRLYGTNGGKTFLTSADGGTSWIASQLPRPIAVSSSTFNGGAAIAVALRPAGRIYAIADNGKIEESKNFGATWSVLAQQPASFSYAQYFGSIAVEQARPFAVFAADGFGDVAMRAATGGAWTANSVLSQTSIIGSVPARDWIVGTGSTGLLAYECLVTKDSGQTVANACASITALGLFSFSAGKQDLFVFGGGGGAYALPLASVPAAAAGQSAGGTHVATHSVRVPRLLPFAR